MKRLKIFISCALGAGIGTMVALEIHPYFWWVGLIVGGLTGYLSYEVKEVLAASRTAWRKVIGYKLDKELWKLRFLLLWWINWAAVTIIVVITLCLLLFLQLSGVKFIVLMMGILILGTFFLTTLWITFEATTKGNLLNDIDSFKPLNPIRICCYYLPQAIWWCLRKTPAVIVITAKKVFTGSVITARFIKMVCILIHSEIRLLCGIGAAIGAAIGYFTGSVVIGMLAGGIIGIADYEIVSKRLLKLSPNDA